MHASMSILRTHPIPSSLYGLPQYPFEYALDGAEAYKVKAGTNVATTNPFIVWIISFRINDGDGKRGLHLKHQVS